jgi:hypothetical protein
MKCRVSKRLKCLFYSLFCKKGHFEREKQRNSSFSKFHSVDFETMFLRVWIFFLIQSTHLVLADHYKGGTISWKPVTPTIITGSISIIITERDSWTFSRYPCNQSIVTLSSSYNDTQAAAPPSIICISSAALCTASLFQNISSPLSCTDFSNVYQVTTGVVYTTQSLPVSSIIDIASRGTAWASEILTNDWSLVSHMDLTPISGKINTSPGKSSLLNI